MAYLLEVTSTDPTIDKEADLRYTYILRSIPRDHGRRCVENPTECPFWTTAEVTIAGNAHTPVTSHFPTDLVPSG